MAISPLLQIRAIVRHQSSHGVSIAYQGVLLVGFVLWFSYGIASDNWRDHRPERRRDGRVGADDPRHPALPRRRRSSGERASGDP